MSLVVLSDGHAASLSAEIELADAAPASVRTCARAAARESLRGATAISQAELVR